MAPDDVVLSFDRVSSRHAIVNVRRASPSPVGVVRSHKETLLQVGWRQAPVIELVRFVAPDCPWSIERVPGARLLPDSPEPPWEFAEPLLEWCEGTSVRRGFGLFHWLPAGDYILVRSPLGLDRERLVLGNDTIVCPEDMRRIDLPARRFVGVVVGGSDGLAPALDVPLLGLVLMNYDELGSRIDGALFCQLIEDGPVKRGDEGLDRVLVVPTAGDFVVDAEASGTSVDPRAASEAWAGARAERFAVALAGERGDRIVRAR